MALANERQANANALQAEQNEKVAQKERDEVKTLNAKLEATLKELQATQARLRNALYLTHISFAQHAWEADAADRVKELLAKDRPQPGEADLRGFEWHYLSRLCPADRLVIQAEGQRFAHSPDGKRLVGVRKFGLNGPGDPVAKVWDAQTGQELLSLKGHTKAVRLALFSPDSKRLATTADDNTVRVWNAKNGQELLVLKGRTQAVRAIFSPDSMLLATSDVDNSVRVWDTQNGQELHNFKRAEGERELPVQLAFSPDGNYLACSSFEVERGGGKNIIRREGPLRVWVIRTGQELFNVEGVGNQIAFGSDGKRLVTCSWMDGVSKVLDARTGKELLLFKAGGEKDGFLKGAKPTVAFSADGKLLASGRMTTLGVGEEPIRVWDVQSGKELLTLRGRSASIDRLVFSPDAKRLASVSSDRIMVRNKDGMGGYYENNNVRVKVWDVQTGQKLHEMIVNNPLNSLAFSPDGKQLVASDSDGVRVWDVQPLAFVAGTVATFSLSQDGKRLATASLSGERKEVVDLQVWDAQTGQQLLTLKGLVGFRLGGKMRLAFSPDGKRLAGVVSKMAKVWDAHTGQELVTIEGEYLAISGIAFSPDGNKLALYSKLWDAHTGQELLTLKNAGVGMAFSQDGTRLVGSGSEGQGKEKTIVWDARTGEELVVRQGTYLGVAFSPDGKRLAGLGPYPASSVIVWDAQTGKELLTLKGHAEQVQSLAFSPDGRRLVSAPDKKAGQVKIWNAETGEELLTLNGQGPLAFSPDGHRLFGRGADGVVKIWDATPLPEKKEP